MSSNAYVSMCLLASSHSSIYCRGVKANLGVLECQSHAFLLNCVPLLYPLI